MLHNNISWATKYEPKTSTEIICNKNLSQTIKNNINKSNTNIIISGNSGVGKTTTIKLILNELNINFDNDILRLIKDKEKLQDIIDVITNTNSIFETKRLAIIINDIKTITSKEEKKILTSLCKYNKTNKIITIIFIIDAQHNKYMNELKKFATEYKFKSPTHEEMKVIADKIISSEKIRFESQAVKNTIIKYAQEDIARLINILYELYITKNNTPITADDYHLFVSQSTKKTVEPSLFEAAKSLFNNYRSIDYCLDLYANDKVLLPLMLYSNYMKVIFNRLPNKAGDLQVLKKQLNVARTIGDFYSTGDVIETNIYTDQSWANQIVYGFYTLVICSYTLNRQLPKVVKDYNIYFSQDLNKNSLRNINKKKTIAPLQEIFKDKTLDDLMYINKIIQHLVNTNQSNLALEYCLNERVFSVLNKQKQKRKNQTSLSHEDAAKKCLELILKINKN